MAESLKLNLGCGAKKLPGFVNVDLPDNWCKVPPDLAADITKPLPFDDGTADEVHAYHVIEHFSRWKAEEALKDWIRVLKPGGLLVLEMPCLDKILGIFFAFAQRDQLPPEAFGMWGLFGDPNYKTDAMTHRWCYSIGEMTELLEGFGLAVEVKEPLTHVRQRDFRVEARKP